MINERIAADRLKAADEWIHWVLSNPNTSPWVKDAVETALHRDPVKILNDLELLNLLLRTRAEALVTLSMSSPRPIGREWLGE